MQVLKLNLPLSDQPIYVSITDENQSIDSAISQAIEDLNNTGRTHEATQLKEMAKDHDIFNKGKATSKGSRIGDLQFTEQEVNGTKIQIAEIELIKQHVGGNGE